MFVADSPAASSPSKAASEPKVTELFARAERQRKPCGQKPSVLARLSNTFQHDWLAAPAMPKLRGHLAAR